MIEGAIVSSTMLVVGAVSDNGVAILFGFFVYAVGLSVVMWWKGL